MLGIFLIVITIGLAHFLFASFGFGNVIVALPLLSLFWNIKLAVPVLVILSVIGAVQIIISDKCTIEWKSLINILIPASLGLPLGIFIYAIGTPRVLEKILGLVIAFYVLKELIIEKEINLSRHKIIGALFSFLGGVAEGAIGTGGPFMVLASKNVTNTKEVFRSTLLLVWIILGLIWFFNYVFLVKGPVIPVAIPVMVSLPVVVFTQRMGSRFYHRLSQDMFSKLVNLLLLLTGILLLFR
ncbi:MAG: sulfite exporter TauE/SafE family protein [Bacillota bacterium]